MRPGFRFRGSKRRVREIEPQHGQDRWWILLALLILEGLAALTWALAS